VSVWTLYSNMHVAGPPQFVSNRIITINMTTLKESKYLFESSLSLGAVDFGRFKLPKERINTLPVEWNT
jgi:hypothetical protein